MLKLRARREVSSQQAETSRQARSLSMTVLNFAHGKDFEQKLV